MSSADDLALVDAAWQVMERAYAPYSNFRVGAALRTSDGRIFTGCNVENATYGATVCAERNAICKAVSEGMQPGQVVAVAVATPTEQAIPPCGICRQSIEEFAAPDCRIMMSIKPGHVTKTMSQGQLLPFSFGKKDLE